MNAFDPKRVSRRGILAAGGILVAFSLSPRATGQGGEGSPAAPPKPPAPGLPGSLKTTPELDAWIRLDPEGTVTVFTGKAELGQGIRTALTQVAAEELDVPMRLVRLITADTARTPNEGYTAGSHSMQDSGTAIANAAANVRMLLVAEAAQRWSVTADDIAADGAGALKAPDGRRLTYADLAAALDLTVEAIPDAPRRKPFQFKILGREAHRVDIPAKLTGGAAYVQDLRLPEMLHARVVRGPSDHTLLNPAGLEAAGKLPGVVKIVRNGRFAAIVAEREWTAIQALRLAQAAGWTPVNGALPADAHAVVKASPSQDETILDVKGQAGAAAHTVKARYSRPWLMHGSIGPSCAIAQFKDGTMTVWTHTQGVFPQKKALAQLLGLSEEQVHCIHVEGSGCYGHNGADDVAADAALAAMAVPGRPVRMQWMREQEHGWEPLGAGMTVDVEASLDASGRIVDWRYELWSNPHNNRPGSAGQFVAGAEVDPPFPPDVPKPIPMPEGGSDRNGVPIYVLSTAKVVSHFIPASPFRVSALRSLGAHMNVFAIESLMDELARAGGQDPVAFRLAHLQDQRGHDAVTKCAEAFGWAKRAKGDGRHGCGFAFARYKNLAAYCAVAMEVEVEHETGAIAVRRVVAAVDAGQAANPDGIRNQIEGAIVQSLSWTMLEQATYDAQRRTSFDWSAYPIARFHDVPDGVRVEVINRPGMPFLGAGEAGQGPAGAALANALADATGLRMRDMPLSPERVKAALGV